MSNQSTLHRTLEMIVLLSQRGGRTVESLAEEFEVHTRTILRTINTIRMAGFYVDKHGDRYYMNREKNDEKVRFDITDILAFTREEIWLLNQTLERLPLTITSGTLQSKLFSVIGAESTVTRILENEQYKMVKTITEAIENKTMVRLDWFYWNTQSKIIVNYEVEPIQFALDYTRVWVYSLEMGNALLRLSSISGLNATNVPFKNEDKHKIGFIDGFGGSSFEKKRVGLKLNARAYGFFVSECPGFGFEAGFGNDQIHEVWIDVCNYFHVSRFCLGLPGDIEILTPELKEYMELVKNKSDKVHHEPSSVGLFDNEMYSGDMYDNNNIPR